MAVLESQAGRGGVRAGQLTGLLGLEVVPAKVEGVRSKAKCLADRGWTCVDVPGMFTAATPPVPGESVAA
ncbi:hypothetical protein ACIHCQ_05490 [Streptomyces sp. NPDC052236]|uniref:hypothetical protein n=1 Tax=Streptomyces sp. NPDC052236 TaxID=3365686 RepID=UPI0037D92D52